MAEYIRKDELVENLDRFAPEHFTPLLKTLIEKQPTADVVDRASFEKVGQKYLAFQQAHLAGELVDVVHAKWEIGCDGYYPYCSHCNTEPKNGVMSKYCPECGAKMDGKEGR